MKDVLQKFIDVKALVTSFTVVIALISGAYTQLDKLTEKAISAAYANFTDPTYVIVKFDLLKQLEKLQTDPEDIKRQDVLKFTVFCDGYFLTDFVPRQSAIDRRNIEVACDKIINLYNQSGV